MGLLPRRSLLASAAFLFAACGEAPTTTPADSDAAPFAVSDAREDLVPGQFIVMFHPDVTDAPGLARQLVAAHGGELRHTYTHAIKGFAARLSDAAAAALARNPNVAVVEADQVVWAVGTTQTGATWGLDRIDQRSLPLSTTYTYARTGSGVTVYIIDTGIRFSHSEFGGRASSGTDAVDGGTADDCNGHGTHVAGTVGGTQYGVAKGVSLVAVRVLDCGGSGTMSGVIAGVDWVTANHAASAVANMSLGGGASSTLDAAVNNSIQAGVSYAVAAGNGNFFGFQADACNYSPARVPAAMTIGATDNTDRKASWSNYGNCVDFFAPGVSITSAWHGSDTQTNTISGTSMATPHVAGAAALHLEGNPGATPAQVRDALYAATTKGIVTSSSTANNHLLYVDGGGTTSPPPTPTTITLTARGSKRRGSASAALEWGGATSASVDVFRNGAKVTTTTNDGAHTDTIGKGASGTYTYKVCEAGTTTCSNEASVSF